MEDREDKAEAMIGKFKHNSIVLKYLFYILTSG